MIRIGAFGLTLAVLLSGCGGAAPVSPSLQVPAPGEPAITGLVLTAPRHVLTGRSISIDVLAALQGGTTRAITGATLTTSDANVLAVQADGSIWAVDLGTAVVTASYRGFQKSLAVTTEPDFAGVWNQTYEVVGCADENQLRDAGWCRRLQGAGQLPLSVGLARESEADAAYRTLSGSALFGSVPCSLRLYVDDDGRAKGTCRFTFPKSSRFEIGNEQVFIFDGTAVDVSFSWTRSGLRGRWSWVVFYNGGRGVARQTNELAPGGTWLPRESPTSTDEIPPVQDLAAVLQRLIQG